jgi:AraC family ethanolamine operon transcriptional activator
VAIRRSTLVSLARIYSFVQQQGRKVNATIESFHDIDEQATRLIGYDQRYEQHGRGQFHGQFVTQRLSNDVAIFIEHCNLSLFQQGSVPCNSVSLQFLVSAKSDCIMNGQRISLDTVMFLPGGASFDHAASPDMSVCVAHFPAALLADLVPAEQLCSIFVTNRRLSDRLRWLVTDSVFGNEKHASSNSSALTAARVANELSAITQQFVLERHQTSNTRRNDWRIVRRALTLIDAQLDTSIRIVDLCRAVGVSRRALENAFVANLGHGPAQQIRIARLNAVRRGIALRSERQDSIGDIAAEFGVWHLGRLAKDFRDLFGQGPREYRQRRRLQTMRAGAVPSADNRTSGSPIRSGSIR